MKKRLGITVLQSSGLLALNILTACASTTQLAPERPEVEEYVFDMTEMMLRGTESSKDRLATICQKKVCIVLLDDDMRKIEEYVTTLESITRSCLK